MCTVESILVDLPHQLHLVVALLNILLVYANGIDPEPVSLVPLSKISQCRLGVFGNEEMLITVDFNLDLGLRISPHV